MTFTPITIFALGLAVSAAATPLVRAFARRIGAVAAPKRDRWHTAPTAMMGGVAIFIATVTALLALRPSTTETWVAIAASSGLFIVGLIDDFVQMKPYQKLACQLLGASIVVYFGLVLPWTGSLLLNMLITFIWLVGVTNAVNMLDNMDGLAAGIAAIAALALAANFYLNGQTLEALMLAGFGGALAGFLIYNHNPASIFMGDCGSLFVGFLLASMALLNAQGGGGRSRSVVAVLAVPVLVLCIPIFDTTFVTLMRKLAGRAASQGGRDHTSHRLVALGLSERHAVWMLYVFAILGGALAIGVRKIALDQSLAAIAAFTIVLGILGVYLAGVRVYSQDELDAAQKKPLVAFLFDISYKRRIFEMLLDVVLIVLAYYGAHTIVLGPAIATSPGWAFFLKALPAIVFIKLATFLAFGVYRGLWRYAGVADGVLLSKAVALGSVASIVLVVFAFQFEAFSRSVFVLDALLLMMLMVGSRFAFRMLRKMFPAPHARTGKRALIYGAGDAGELLWRELNNNTALGYVPVAFVDDDSRKAGKVIHGLPVYSGLTPLTEIARMTRAEELFLSTDQLPFSKVRAIAAACEAMGMPVKRMRIDIYRVADRELGWVVPSASDTAGPILPATTLDTRLHPIARPRVADDRVIGH
jgi:UDP-GlcNAc:undecaprenyl-phosphate GlcNAc-1-phosphate transferase